MEGTDPRDCRSVGDLVAALREQKVRAGDPSVRELARRIRDDRRRRCGPAAEAVSPTTIWYCFDPTRRRLDHGLVFDLLTALGVAEERRDWWRQAWRQAVAGPPDPASTPVVTGAPPEPDGFVGRSAEVARMLAAGTALVVVTGMAGAGKSWLAARAAAGLLRTGRYDLALTVNLQGFDPDRPPAAVPDVLDALLRALGPAGGDPARAGRARAYREALRGRRVLLTLDNAADAEQVRPLLADAPGCLTLVTSRRAIAVPGATLIELAGLPPAESLALVRSAAGADRLAAAPAAAGEIAELCGHLPLALGLSAGHLRAHPDWPLADHAERLRLVGPAGVVPALTLSYERLDPAEREMFRLLGEHPGPHVTAAAAAALTGADPDTARARLAVLAAANLLAERAPGRYELHDLVRAYAAGRAVEEDPASVRRQAFGRLFEFSVGAAADAVDSLHGRRPGSGPPAEAQAWLDAERPVLLSLAGRAEAAGWPDRSAELTAELAAVLRTYLDVGSWNADARRLHRHALHAARSRGDRAAQGDALHNLALAESRLGAVAAAVSGFGRALAVRRELGDRTGEVRTLGQLASTESRRGRYHQAQRHLREAVAAADPADPVVLSYLLSSQATALIKLGEDAAAAAVLTRAIGLAEAAADRYGLGWMENNLGVAGRQLGRLGEAVERHERALALHREVGDRAGEAFAESNLGIDRRLLGRLPEALAHAERSIALAEEVGDPGMSAQLGNDAAETLYAAGRTAEALAGHRAALTAARRGADRHEQARAHHGIAVVLAGSGRSGRAAPHQARARAIYEDLGVPMASV